MEDNKLVKFIDAADKPKRKKPPAAGMGRKKGSVNKFNKEIKDMILSALEKAGGENYLLEQAQTNPTAFMSLVGKVIPKDLNAKVEGSMNLTVLTGLPLNDNEQSGH